MCENPLQESKGMDCLLFLCSMFQKQRFLNKIFWKDILCEKITIIDRQHKEMYLPLWQLNHNF